MKWNFYRAYICLVSSKAILLTKIIAINMNDTTENTKRGENQHTHTHAKSKRMENRIENNGYKNKSKYMFTCNFAANFDLGQAFLCAYSTIFFLLSSRGAAVYCFHVRFLHPSHDTVEDERDGEK